MSLSNDCQNVKYFVIVYERKIM